MAPRARKGRRLTSAPGAGPAGKAGAAAPSPCRLYLLSPPQIGDLDAFAAILPEVLAAGDVAAFQLRLKGPANPETGEEAAAPDEAILAAGGRLIALVQQAGVAAILNDRPDLARTLGVDGVHLGPHDAPYEEARRHLGPRAIIGVSCQASRHRAMTAAEAGADYVAFGAFFPTATKGAVTPATTEIVEWWSEIFTTPCVAIGGITAANCAPLVTAGADFLAVSSAVWGHSRGPAAGAAELHAAIAAALRA